MRPRPSSLILVLMTAGGLAFAQEHDWIERHPLSVPGLRVDHAMAYDSARGRVVLFGGTDGPTYLDETWEWDGSTWIKKSPVDHPGARRYPAMAYDSDRGKTVLFGGTVDGTHGLGDTWEWDGVNWIERHPAHVPLPRQGAGMAYDSTRHLAVLLGGYSETAGFPSDMWEWDGVDWSQRTIQGPYVTSLPSLAYDSVRRRLVLFSPNGDGSTYEWDGTAGAWTNRSPASGPAPRCCATLVYDSARARSLLFGGSTSTQYPDDTWEWDGTLWSPRAPVVHPVGRWRHAMTYDSKRGQVVLYGGEDIDVRWHSETWEFPGCEALPPGAPYGRLLLPGLCTGDPATLSQSVYASVSTGLYRGAHSHFYLSASGTNFAPLVVDDELRVNGTSTGLGSYSPQPGTPPFVLDQPIETNLVPQPAPEVTALIPSGLSPVLFEAAHTASPIYGLTPVYLVEDCGIALSHSPTRVSFISHDDEIFSTQPQFEMRTGLLSVLRHDLDYRSAACLGPFAGTPADVPPGTPPLGDGFYYVARGLNRPSCNDYGDSTLVPDPRRALDALPACQ